MKTQAEIDAIAEQVRAAGTPDSLNRWLGMTPETLAVSETMIARQIAGDRKPRGVNAMPRTVGPKEQALRDLKTGTAGAAPQQEETVAKKKAKTKTEAKSAPAKKKTDAKKDAQTKARTPVQEKAGTARRPNSKMGIIAGLLARKNGCTAMEVREACEWPSVSMPQQAKALGVELYKKKDDNGVTHYADHAL